MQINNPKISVIMPSLNVEPFIRECLDSVINQTFESLEIICVDGGSTDGTLEILEEYAKKDSRVKIIQTDKKSYGHQMNLGVNASNGEYIGIVETDDFIDAKMYETLYDLTNESSSDISKVNFYHYYRNSDFKSDETKKDLPTNEFNVYDNANILNGHPSIWAAIYKKDFLKKNNIEFMEVSGGGWVDNPFLFKTMLAAEKITYKDEPFYYYRELNPNSSTNDLKDLTLPMKRMLNIFEVLDEYSCRDENILKAFYIRIFWHINDILKKDKYVEQEKEIFKYTHEVVLKMDETIVKNNFGRKRQSLYYKYLNPLTLKEIENDNVTFSKEEMNQVIKNNQFLLEYIDNIHDKNSKLRLKNKKIHKQNKKIYKENKVIANSRTYKLGFKVLTPARYLKRIIKK